MRLLSPCIVCATPTKGTRCTRHLLPRIRPAHRSAYNTQAWRKASKQAREAQPFCSSCGSTQDLTADHYIPLARGGEAVPPSEHIVVLCRRCNASKGAR